MVPLHHKDDEGKTALYYAKENGHEEIVQILMQSESE